MMSLDQIARSLGDFDPSDLPVEQARAFLGRVVATLPALPAEPVALADALGRVLADDAVSPIDVPPHDNAAMDGYAFDGAALAAGGEITLRVAGCGLAGAVPSTALAAGEALRIMTGAVMPAGADTVVPQELCRTDGESLRFAAAAVRPGAHRRLAGEDLRAGRAALPAGERIGPAALGLLASLGRPAVSVRRRLRVACLTTGDELMQPGEPPREGAVYDSNRFALRGLLQRLGCEILDIGPVRDDPGALDAALREATRRADVVIGSGGMGPGEADHMRAALQRAGQLAVWHLAMRPGRPMAVGLLHPDSQAKSGSIACGAGAGSYENNSNPVLFLGLPGNPVATMVSFLVFVRPALLARMGCHAQAAAGAPPLRARCTTPLRKRPGRTEYLRGTVRIAADGRPEVQVGSQQGSGVLRSMAQANALVVLAHGQADVPAGSEVEVLLFDGLM